MRFKAASTDWLICRCRGAEDFYRPLSPFGLSPSLQRFSRLSRLQQALTAFFVVKNTIKNKVLIDFYLGGTVVAEYLGVQRMFCRVRIQIRRRRKVRSRIF
jgi:hypothetical protein